MIQIKLNNTILASTINGGHEAVTDAIVDCLRENFGLEPDRDYLYNPPLNDTTPATEDAVKFVFENEHSEWRWVRLPSGDLMLGVFPLGDTYEHISQQENV